MLKLEVINRALRDARGEGIHTSDREIDEATVDALNFFYHPKDACRRSIWMGGLPVREAEIIRLSKEKIGLSLTEAMRRIAEIRERLARQQKEKLSRRNIALTRVSKSIESLGCEYPTADKGGAPTFVRREAVQLYWALLRIHRPTWAASIAAHVYNVSDSTIARWAKNFSYAWVIRGDAKNADNGRQGVSGAADQDPPEGAG